MTNVAHCPHCQTRYPKVPSQAAGKSVRCRKCGHTFVVNFETDPYLTHPQGEESPPARPAAPVSKTKLDLEDDPVNPPPMAVRKEPAPTVRAATPTQSIDNPEETLVWDKGEIILDLYEVLSVLGQGGMGRVYKVRHRGWNAELAVKTPTSATLAAAGGVEEFEKEAETWVNLGLHPHAVTCYYVRRIKGIPCIFIECVRGGSLHNWIYGSEGRPGRLYAGGPGKIIPRLLDIAIQFAWGLHYAHEQGLVHRDVKPANLLLSENGLAKVTDFGLAEGRLLTLEDTDLVGPGPPASGQVCAGTPQYFAPEQMVGGAITPRTDMWAWGLSILEMFKGGRTWDSGTVAAEVLAEYVKTGPEGPWLPPMPQALANLLASIFMINPADRPVDLVTAVEVLIEAYAQTVGTEYPRRQPKAGRATADSINNRAISWLDLGRQADAELLWEQALQTQPHHPQATYNLGLYLWRGARLNDDALLRQLSESSRSHRQDWAITYYQALIHLERDDVSSAGHLLRGLTQEGQGPEEVKKVFLEAEIRQTDHKGLKGSCEGHTGPVNAVCFDLKGTRAFSVGEDRTIRAWEAPGGNPLWTVPAHNGPITALDLSEDGRYLISGGGDFTGHDFKVKIWDAVSGHQIRELAGHDRRVTGVALNRDGSWALSTGDDHAVRWWETQTGVCRKKLPGKAGMATASWLSPDGRHALLAATDSIIRLYSLEDVKVLRTLSGHEARINSIDVDEQRRQVLSGGADQTVRLWDLVNGKLIKTFSGHRGEVNAVCLRRDGRFAFSAGSDQTIKLWAVDSGRCLRTFEGHNSWVVSLAINYEGNAAVSGGLDNKVLFWQTEARVKPFHAPMLVSGIESSETATVTGENYNRFLLDARQALANRDYDAAAENLRVVRSQPGYERAAEAMQLWGELCLHLTRGDLSGGWEGPVWTGHGNAVRALALSRDGRLVLSGSSDQSVRLWDQNSGKVVTQWTGHTRTINSVALSRNGTKAWSGSADNTVRRWETGQADSQVLITCQSRVNAICLTPDETRLLSAEDDGLIRVWDAETGRLDKELIGHKTPVEALAVSHDGLWVASAGGDPMGEDCLVILWDLASGRILKTFAGHQRVVGAVAFSPRQPLIVSAGADHLIMIWDLISGNPVNTLKGHTGAVNSVAISADGRFLLSASFDQTVKIWNMETGRCLRTFQGHTGSVSAAAFSPEASRMFSAGEDKVIRTWVLDWTLNPPPVRLWDDSVRPWLQAFLTVRASGPAIRPRLALTASDDFSDEEITGLHFAVSCAGFGWLNPDTIKQKLLEMSGKTKIVGESSGFDSTPKTSSPEPTTSLLTPLKITVQPPKPPTSLLRRLLNKIGL